MKILLACILLLLCVFNCPPCGAQDPQLSPTAIAAPQPLISAQLKEQPKHEFDSDLKTGSIRMLQALGLCIAVLLIGTYILKKARGHDLSARKQRRLKILDRVALSPKSSVCLLECDGKNFLVALGSEHVSVNPMPGRSFEEVLDLGSTVEAQAKED